LRDGRQTGTGPFCCFLLIVSPRLCYTFKPGTMTKSRLRTQMKETLTRLTPALVEQKSGRINTQLISLSCFTEAGRVLVYLSMDTEVRTGEIIRAARQAGKPVFAPRIKGQELVFHPLPESAVCLEHNRFGIPEPPAGRPLFGGDKDDGAAHAASAAANKPTAGPGIKQAGRGHVLVITPGLAFDRAKNRLGRGKGYYDRFIRQIRAWAAGGCIVVGVCFAEQLVDTLPVNNDDMPVDLVITDGEIIY